MRDIIWTLIIVWLIYKLTEIFRNAGSKKRHPFSKPEQSQAQGNAGRSTGSALRKGADKEGEYIDYEEIR